MGELVHLGGKRIFTLDEAQSVVPILRRITEKSIRKAETIIRSLEQSRGNKARRAALEARFNEIVEAWVKKVERLGAEAKGLWIVDFDSGVGYYCWQYGESSVQYFHGYADGFGGRVRIQRQRKTRIAPVSPLDDRPGQG
jgi:hypothetical protein